MDKIFPLYSQHGKESREEIYFSRATYLIFKNIRFIFFLRDFDFSTSKKLRALSSVKSF